MGNATKKTEKIDQGVDLEFLGLGAEIRKVQGEADVLVLSLVDKLALKYKGRQMTEEAIKEVNAFQKANDLTKRNGSYLIGESMIRAFPKYNSDANADIRTRIQTALTDGQTADEMRDAGLPTTQTKLRANLKAIKPGAGGRPVKDKETPTVATPDAKTIALYVGQFLNNQAVNNQDKEKLIEAISVQVDAYNARVAPATARVANG